LEAAGPKRALTYTNPLLDVDVAFDWYMGFLILIPQGQHKVVWSGTATAEGSA